MSQTVTIEFEGVMVLSFRGEEKCTIGVPPTDDRHEFLLTVDGKPRVIGKQSSLAVVDAKHERLPARVTKQAGFFDTVIDFKSTDFHPELRYRSAYVNRNRLEILNGHFEVGRVVRNIPFKRGDAESDITRSVAESIKLTVTIEDGQQVVFTDINGEVTLQPGQQISITNDCVDADCGGVPDFQYHYRAFDVTYNQQRIPVIVRSLSASSKQPVIEGTPDLPCWSGGYEEPPPPPPPG